MATSIASWVHHPGDAAVSPTAASDRRHRRVRLSILGAVIGLLFASFPLAAQQLSQPPNSGTGAQHQPSPLATEATPRYDQETNLTGDWGGLRNTLAEEGFKLELSYAMEFMANPTGGEDQGETYVHNILLGLDFDLDKLIGLPNSTFRVRGSQRSGDSLSKDYIGNAFSVQELYGGGQTWRLAQVEMEHDLFGGRLNLAYGRLGATDDFLNSPLYCQFVSNAICGQPPSPFFNMPTGISSYPLVVWGARARVQPMMSTYAQVAVYDGDWEQDGRNDHGTNLSFGSNGVLLLSEAGYKPDRGLLGLPAAYKVGGYYHTGDFEDVGGTRVRSGNSGVYTLIDQMLYREDPTDTQGLYGFFVFVAAPEQDRNIFPYFVSGGLIYEGLIDARPEDKAGFAIASGFYSQDLRKSQRDASLDEQYAETILELNYQYQVTGYFYFRPDIQYVATPSGYDDIDNAFVVGVEAGITF
jgi:porin